MSATKLATFSGWGRTTAMPCLAFRPEKQRDVKAIMQRHPSPLLARGLGRSYGDAALQPQGLLLTERLDRFIEFDRTQGVVRAQAGMTLGDLMETTIPAGWFPPVIPGTKHVTLGGSFACNVHGKNHWRDGDFAEHVLSIRLRLPSGERIECSSSEHSDIFWATAGGMGMTGIIEDITLKLRPIASASLKTATRRVANLDDMLAAFEEQHATADYMVGWIDHMVGKRDLGRGVFEAAAHITTAEGGKPLGHFRAAPSSLSVPCSAPAWLLNRYSIALYNHWRFRRCPATRQVSLAGLDGFFHPLDRLGKWNRLYGKRGFFQYQCVLPQMPDSARTLAELLLMIQDRRLLSFLAVLKYHRQGKGPLTFPLQGYSLALDFPNTHRVRALMPEINQFVAQHGGRTYLAKDATLTPGMFRAMYPCAPEWMDTLRDLDPDSRFLSVMAQRLQWKTPA